MRSTFTHVSIAQGVELFGACLMLAGVMGLITAGNSAEASAAVTCVAATACSNTTYPNCQRSAASKACADAGTPSGSCQCEANTTKKVCDCSKI